MKIVRKFSFFVNFHSKTQYLGLKNFCFFWGGGILGAKFKFFNNYNVCQKFVTFCRKFAAFVGKLQKSLSRLLTNDPGAFCSFAVFI